MLRVACVPSNQHLNQYKGLPGVTEEKWAVATCKYLCARLLAYGVEARVFHKPGTGSSSTDELGTMVSQVTAWKPDYTLSVHSDAVGDKKQTGILMLMAREADAADGQKLGLSIAKHVGLPYKSTWVYGVQARKILYLRALRENNLQGSLVEVGEHATVAEASWNWTRTQQIGVGIADALAEHLGIIEQEGEDMTDEERKMLKQCRLSDIAQSHDLAILKAMADPLTSPDSIRDMEVRKKLDVEANRKALGL